MLKIIMIVFICLTFSAYGQQNKKKKTPAPRAGVNNPLDTTLTEKIVKSDDERKKILTSNQYYILRKYGTERSFSSKLYEVKDEGIYVWAGCKNPLFASDAKFNSETGWPGYFQPYSKISLNVGTDNSIGKMRDALTCKIYDGHPGHVINDGPEPTGLRYCIDGNGLPFFSKQQALSVTLAKVKDLAKINPDK